MLWVSSAWVEAGVRVHTTAILAPWPAHHSTAQRDHSNQSVLYAAQGSRKEQQGLCTIYDQVAMHEPPQQLLRDSGKEGKVAGALHTACSV